MRRSSTSSSVSTEHCVSAKAKEVLHLLTRKGPPLTLKQQEYCSEACINRILGTRQQKQKMERVKKAAKQLRATLTWRASFDVDCLTADEFSAELAAGVAYVAGHDEQNRPVLIVRINSESSTSQAQKKLLRFFVFTLEVAIASMEAPVEQCVLIIQAGSLRKGSRAISTVFQLLKLFSEHYPKRLARAFMLDAPFMFYYLWKGIGSLLDLGANDGLRFVYTRNYTSTQATTYAASHLTRAVKSYSNGSIEWEEQDDDTSSKPNKGIQSQDIFCATTTTTSAVSPSCKNEASLLSDKSKARSSSFATSWIKPLVTSKESEKASEFRSFRVPTTKQQRQGPRKEQEGSRRWCDLSLIDEAGEESNSLNDSNQFEHKNTKQKATDLFRPYYFNLIKCKPYNEASYREKLKPPLAGLISIVSSDLSCIKQQRHEAIIGLKLHN